MVSPDGACKSFDAAANGYARAEGVAVVVLARELAGSVPWTALRHAPYAKILACQSNNNGFQDKGITFPSTTAQADLAKQARPIPLKFRLFLIDHSEHVATSSASAWGDICQSSQYFHISCMPCRGALLC